MVAGADAVLSLAVTSQWVARRFGYNPRLGPPAYVPSPHVQLVSELVAVLAGALALISLVACIEGLTVRRAQREAVRNALTSVAVAIVAALASLGAWELAHAPLYGMAVIRWWRWWHGMTAMGGRTGAATLMLWAGAERVFWTAMVLFPSVGAFAWFAWRVGRPRPVDGSRGTALWSTGATLTGQGGVPLGWAQHGSRQVLLRAPIEGHLVTIAPTGAGKGVGAVIRAHMIAELRSSPHALDRRHRLVSLAAVTAPEPDRTQTSRVAAASVAHSFRTGVINPGVGMGRVVENVRDLALCVRRAEPSIPAHAAVDDVAIIVPLAYGVVLRAPAHQSLIENSPRRMARHASGSAHFAAIIARTAPPISRERIGSEAVKFLLTAYHLRMNRQHSQQ